jgi:hypothetical protein
MCRRRFRIAFLVKNEKSFIKKHLGAVMAESASLLTTLLVYKTS